MTKTEDTLGLGLTYEEVLQKLLQVPVATMTDGWVKNIEIIQMDCSYQTTIRFNIMRPMCRNSQIDNIKEYIRLYGKNRYPPVHMYSTYLINSTLHFSITGDDLKKSGLKTVDTVIGIGGYPMVANIIKGDFVDIYVKNGNYVTKIKYKNILIPKP